TYTKKQANRDLLEFYAPEQGYALALSVDTVLARIVDDLTTNIKGTLVQELAYEDVLDSRQALDDANVPADGRVIDVSPAQEKGFLKLNQFVHRDYDSLHGDPSKPAMNVAYIGTWMGYPVYKSTNIAGSNAAGHNNAMFHK